MTRTVKRIAILALAASLVACQTKDPANQRAVGAVAGALLGVFIGYNLGGGSGRAVMMMLGAGAGGALGLYAVDEIIKRDKKKRERAAYRSLTGAPEGKTVYWENRETGSAGSFTVVRSYTSAQGRVCREIDANIMGAARTVKERQTACQLHNGAWELI